MMKKIRIGVIGVGRGKSMIRYCAAVDNAEVVAICDKWTEGLEMMKKKMTGHDIAYYTDYDEFLKHDMDAVVLANYATEHAPFAIKAMKAGKHVLSEVLPVQTMKEAVELVETVEETGMVYAYAENYCYMPAPREMRKLYREGKLGEFEYGEGEYAHNCETINAEITYGDPDHWRNNTYSTYYCTHSIGPLLHITGLRPVEVTGFELPYNARKGRMGGKGTLAALEIMKMENGAYCKSVHGDGISKNSIWYTLYGPMGRIESAREDVQNGKMKFLYTNLDTYEGENNREDYVKGYEPRDELSDKADSYGHGGSDYYSMWNFVEKIRGKEDADTIDVYEALDMGLTGYFAFQSALMGNIPMEIPNFRSKLVREKYRHDTACTNPAKAGEMLLPSSTQGDIEIPDSIYEGLREKWEKKMAEDIANNYVKK